MVPPELSPPTEVFPPPVIVKLPFVPESFMPLVPLPFAETLVSDIAKGDVPEAFVISTAGSPLAAGEPLVLIAPLVVVMVLVFSVASSPR